MAQAVSRRLLTAEVRVRCRVSPCGICSGQSGTGTGFFPEYFGFPLSILFHRCSITWINEKNWSSFFLSSSQGLHNKPQDCGASVACAAGPFSTKKGVNEGITHVLWCAVLVESYSGEIWRSVWSCRKIDAIFNLTINSRKWDPEILVTLVGRRHDI
jgi:hypothetical protein